MSRQPDGKAEQTAAMALPSLMWAVLVGGKVIALFTDQLEAQTYLRVLRGPESILERVSWMPEQSKKEKGR